MTSPPKVLIQLDSDQHPSVFDSVVAIDCGVDHLLPFGDVEPLDVRDLVHGAMFTRGGSALKNTAVFVGGSQVKTGEQILKSVVDSFFGPVRVSVMLDANGANTTAAAAVLCVQRHLDVHDKAIAVLAATGAVGSRCARILASQGACVRVASRSLNRAEALCGEIHKIDDAWNVTPFQTDNPREMDAILDGCDAVLAAGAAGVELLKQSQLAAHSSIRVVLDLNAVPPVGVQGIEPTASGDEVDGRILYGAIGVGGLKMKIHRRAVQSLFTANNRVLDVSEIFALGQKIETGVMA